ncbi:hypothetical protein SAMN00120144_0752 [Hymenobacter roseosalivarius DSM 11622]|uniref:Uncharacterized protein n=1 Tax=Hymenobacter roseosalivarius DSM 11622 TaxID=645990 RepID=A0A1W1URJ2_9BACT|nr:hypothetical protein SAMN00120144_0752 [Hymenobacter roseosalivarius DSM 11622]
MYRLTLFALGAMLLGAFNQKRPTQTAHIPRPPPMRVPADLAWHPRRQLGGHFRGGIGQASLTPSYFLGGPENKALIKSAFAVI